MDHAAIRRLVQKRKIAINELLTQAEFEDVEQILMLLKRLRPADEIGVALMERMAIAPLYELKALKGMYFRHFQAREH
jgi:hypothetical protein